MADRNERIILQLQLDTDQLVRNIIKMKDAVELSTKQLASAKLELKNLESQGITSGATYENLQAKIVQYEKSLAISKESQREYAKQLKNTQLAQQDGGKSLDAQKAQLSVLTARYNDLTKEQRENTDVGKQMKADISALTASLVESENAIGNHRRSVGNYAIAVKEAMAALDESQSNVNDLKLQLQQLNEQIKSGNGDREAFEQQFKEVTEQLKIQTSETEKLGQKLTELNAITAENGEGFKSLRQQVRESNEELQKLADKFSAGLISQDELTAAIKATAALEDKLGDLNKTVDAFNPDAKFKAFTQVAGSLAGGLSAVQGGMALFGAESEDTSKALLKVQAAMAFASGLNQLAELGDAFKNLRLVLGLTTVAQRAQTVAQGQSAVTATANAAATGAMAGAEVTATVATRGLSIAMKSLLGTIGFILIAVTAAAAAFEAFDEHVSTIEDLTDAIDGENAAHQKTIDTLKQKNAAATAATEDEIELAKARGESEQSLFDLRQKLRDENAKGLVKELALNKQHQQELINQKAEAQRIVEDTSSSEEDQKEAAEKIKAIDADLNKTKIRNAEITTVELKRLNNERVVDETETARAIVESQNQLSQLRISNIRNNQQREIEQAQQATKEALDAVLEGDADAIEKKALIMEAGSQKLQEIERRYALQTLQEKNALAIALTVEGTEARIDAEILAAEKERAEILKNDQLTQVQRQRIIQDSENKIFALEQGRTALLQQQAEAELEVERRKRIALQAIRSEQVLTPEQSFDADKKNIQENFDFQLKALEDANEKFFEETSNAANRQIQLNIEKASEKERNTQEFIDRNQKILDDANKKIIENDEATNAERAKLVLDSGNALVEATQKRLNSEAAISVLKLKKTESQINTELATVERGSERELELKRQLEAVKIQIDQAGIDARIKGLEAEQQIKGKLSDEELAEYELLQQQKVEINAQAGSDIIAYEEQAAEQIKQAALGVFDELYNRAVESSRRQTDARIEDINTALDAEIAALDEAQAKEEGTFVAKTATQQKYDEARRKAREKAAAEEKKIKTKQFEAERTAAVIKTIIQTAVNVVSAYPIVPLMIAAGIVGAAEAAIIASQPTPEFYEGGFSDKGGHTGKGNPRDVSTKLGPKPYGIYHNREYIAPARVIETPRGKHLVDSLELIRQDISLGYSEDALISRPPLIQQSITEVFNIQNQISLSVKEIENITREKIKEIESSSLDEETKRKSVSEVKKESEVELISSINEYHTRLLEVTQKATETFLINKVSNTEINAKNVDAITETLSVIANRFNESSTEYVFVRSVSDTSKAIKEFYNGGYTGSGNPKMVSYTHSTPDRTVHLNEYVIPSHILNTPIVSGLVNKVIEPMRAKTVYPSTVASNSFADGGFASASVNLTPNINIPQIDMEAFRDSVVDATVSALRGVQIVTDVKDVITQTGIINKVEDRSNI